MPGILFAATPPLEADQCEASFQSPEFFIQNKSEAFVFPIKKKKRNSGKKKCIAIFFTSNKLFLRRKYLKNQVVKLYVKYTYKQDTF